MSIQAVAWALEQDLPARPKLVLVSIANHANHTDGYCFLRADTIAAEAACTPRSVYRFIGGLVRNGYLRKVPKRGDDGKQRANDYWILFRREPREWDWGAELADAEIERQAYEEMLDEAAAEEAAVAAADDNADTATSSTVTTLPHEGISHGPHERHDSRQPVEKHAVSPGPCDSRVSRKRIAEPSKSNPKASSAGARVHDVALRSYRPPPPQPIAADTEIKTNPVFVYEGSRAYEAWAAIEARKSGLRTWHLVTRACIDGRWRTGWYFPTLFPPADKPQGAADQGQTGPPTPAA